MREQNSVPPSIPVETATEPERRSLDPDGIPSYFQDILDFRTQSQNDPPHVPGRFRSHHDRWAAAGDRNKLDLGCIGRGQGFFRKILHRIQEIIKSCHMLRFG